jgi:chromosome segregation ATPase
MLWKAIKFGTIGVVVVGLVGGLVFGRDLHSYVSSSLHSLRTGVRDSVPIEFELRRARHQLSQIVPEIKANIRMIAKEEVEVAALEEEIERTEEALTAERAKIEKLSGLLGSGDAVMFVGERQYSRSEVKTDLARRFDRYKEAEAVLEAKRRLLATRRTSLEGALTMLDKAKHNKALLADRIEMLEGKWRLVQAASMGSDVRVDNSKFAQTQKLIDQIKKRLDVAERVLAHQGRFVEEIEVDVVDADDLLTQIGEHFQPGSDARVAHVVEEASQGD